MRRDNLLSPSHAYYHWFVVSLLWMSHAIYFFNYNSLGGLGPLLKQELVLNNAHFGHHPSTYFLRVLLEVGLKVLRTWVFMST